ncbi:Bidirectional sugar transporter SWEET5 [Citrus sinensis]|uniref:Bidirectional sugar transporter SWEET5 n=1 Tax=Citrus sinensis TaxID=2711 RepID=A0ACB8LS25_CITSI|nr:Bidirectional sugar transporter SWEET5 [Citrus sinensis]
MQIGYFRNVISLGLFLSPIPTMAAIVRQKSVENFKADPYIATVLNCFVTLVVTINGAGAAIELFYVLIFVIFSSWGKRRKIFVALVVEVVFMAILIFVTLYFLHTTDDRTTVVGIIAVVFNIVMYAAPLTVMKMVISTKSVKYMPLALAIGNAANGAVWVVYACLRFDPYVLIPNGLGTLSGILQLTLYAIFYKTTNWDGDDDENRNDNNGNGNGNGSNNNRRGRGEVQLVDVA